MKTTTTNAATKDDVSPSVFFLIYCDEEARVRGGEDKKVKKRHTRAVKSSSVASDVFIRGIYYWNVDTHDRGAN